MIKLISITSGAGELLGKSPQEIITYNARVSNPNNQLNFKTSDKLLKYCIKHGHWSIFEQADMTLEINTTRGIAAQILRHRSFVFQEFSQRYSKTDLLNSIIMSPELRLRDSKNRQNSIDKMDDVKKIELKKEINDHFIASKNLYDKLVDDNNVAYECARFVLPLATPTRLYMKGSCRNWIHYIQVRSKEGTQKEHMNIALECRNIFNQQFPDISLALNELDSDWKI